jgi:N-acetylglucosaminyl-diphospho-decaprenol L-rhamnosyltransferase
MNLVLSNKKEEQIVDSRVTIIVVTFNSEKVIIKSLSRLDSAKHQIIVVDNGSSDYCCRLIKEHFPDIKLLELGRNIGYGRANNVALRIVETEFAIILNPDALIDSGNIELLLKTMDRDSKIAISAPLLLDGDGSSSSLDVSKKKAEKILRNNLIAEKEELYVVKYLIGAVLCLRMSVFRQIGFFNEKIFLYYEDDEITWRAIKYGYNAVILKNAVAFHLGSGSSGSSLRFLYKRFWHRAFSKFCWKAERKGLKLARISACKLLAMFLIKFLFNLALFRIRKAVEFLASSSGTFAFLLGKGAFDKNDHPRG